MVDMPDARRLGQGEHRRGAPHVRSPGFGAAINPTKRETGSVVDYLAAVLPDPAELGVAQAAAGLPEITNQHSWHPQRPANHLFPAADDRRHPIGSGLSPRWASHHRQRHVGQKQVAKEVGPEESGASGQENRAVGSQ